MSGNSADRPNPAAGGNARRALRTSTAANLAPAADLAGVEELLVAACPEPAVPRNLVHTVRVQARRQRQNRQHRTRWLAGSVLAAVMLCGAFARLPGSSTATDSGSADSQSTGGWSSAATAAFVSPDVQDAAEPPHDGGADEAWIDEALERRTRPGRLLRSQSPYGSPGHDMPPGHTPAGDGN